MGCMICVATAIIGIDFGWEKLPDGGYEYIIQIEPHLLEELREGRRLGSVVDPQVRAHVRSYRIVCGEEPVPRDIVPPELTTPQGDTEPTPETPDESSHSPSDSHPEPGGSLPSLENGTGVGIETNGNLEGMEPEKPWLLFWLAWGVAAGFFWAFVYLLLIHAGTRRRYRALIAEFHGNAGTPSDPDFAFTRTDSPSEP